MPNSQLENRVFEIPIEVLKQLRQNLSTYRGDKTADGYKRLNNLISNPELTYQGIKRIKNFFDKFDSDKDSSAEYYLNGGDLMKSWVEKTLGSSRNAVKQINNNKTDLGTSNKSRDTSGLGTNHTKGGNKNSLAASITNVTPNKPQIYGESKKRIRIIVTESQFIAITEKMVKINNKK